MGPVFSDGVHHPADHRRERSRSGGAGTSAPLAVLLAGIGVFALGWIVAQYAKRIHAAGSLYDYVSNGLGSTMGAATGWLYYGGTIILTTGLGVLLGGYVHDNLLPAFEMDRFPVWVWNALLAVLLFVVLYFGVQLSTRVQLALALVSVAVVLVFFITVIVGLGRGNDFAKAFDPSPRPRRVLGDHLRCALRGPHLRGLRDGGEPRRGDADPKRSIPRAVLMFSSCSCRSST